ncbi:class I SAM-dependent methyltransferase [Pararhodospirillum photometricum]|uniref:class I SAM-dependent methyltransferase n=1 Tax=Pararhodospirillum photometricum TaxID=1084 RepID=UPI0012FEC4F4|nr:class I SAM-dependent methyltransferase [Pararhodospirillum photometricum]
MSALDQTDQFWSNIQETQIEGYWNWDLLAQVVHKKTQGKGIFRYISEKYFDGKGANNALSIGCGSGDFDRKAYEDRAFKKLTGVDISTYGIKAATERAEKESLPFSYHRIDLNSDFIAIEEKYDLIFAKATLHHIKNVEELLINFLKSMTDDAIFIMYDYFGPVRMQWDHRVIDIANSLMRRIPLSLREKLPEVQRTGIYEFLRCDPSEGVSGGNVLEIAKSIFEVVEEINMGSTLGHPMFAYNERHVTYSVPEYLTPCENPSLQVFFILSSARASRGSPTLLRVSTSMVVMRWRTFSSVSAMQSRIQERILYNPRRSSGVMPVSISSKVMVRATNEATLLMSSRASHGCGVLLIPFPPRRVRTMRRQGASCWRACLCQGRLKEQGG